MESATRGVHLVAGPADPAGWVRCRGRAGV